MGTPEPEGLTVHRSSDEVLVRIVRVGDKTAYGLLYDRFALLVRAVCHDYTHNLADAQDLAEEVFLRACPESPGRLPRWTSRSDFATAGLRSMAFFIISC